MEINKDLMRGAVGPIVLKLLSARDMYGYEIIKQVELATNGALQWKEGTLYPCLYRLENDGYISSFWSAAAGKGERPRKYYTLTLKGKKQMAQYCEEWNTYRNAVDALLNAV